MTFVAKRFHDMCNYKFFLSNIQMAPNLKEGNKCQKNVKTLKTKLVHIRSVETKLVLQNQRTKGSSRQFYKYNTLLAKYTPTIMRGFLISKKGAKIKGAKILPEKVNVKTSKTKSGKIATTQNFQGSQWCRTKEPKVRRANFTNTILFWHYII